MTHPSRRVMEAKALRSLQRKRYEATHAAIDVWICGFKAGREHRRKEQCNAKKA